MALTQGITGTNQVTTGTPEEVAFDASIHKQPCTTLMVRCNSGGDALVRVVGLHDGVAAGAGVRVPVGEKEYFRLGEGVGIYKVFIGSTLGTTTVDWGPVASMRKAT